MKRSILSEKNLVVVLFVTVLVIFSFAQEASKNIEKTFLDNNPSATTSLDQTANPQNDKQEDANPASMVSKFR